MANELYAVLAVLALASTTNRRVTASDTTTPSEADFVKQELPNLFCNYRVSYNEKLCRIDLGLLQAGLEINKYICSLAKIYVGCLDENCYKTTALSASIKRVTDRCNGAQSLQAAGMLVLLMLAVHLLKV